MRRVSVNAVEQIVRRAIHDLPAPLREALTAHDTMIEILPEPPEGFEDAFGTFDGSTVHELESPLSNALEPPRIELYLSTFVDLAAEEGDAWEEEVRLTVLHEIGHFLGLEEEDLEEV